jgi:hypothetical protein
MVLRGWDVIETITRVALLPVPPDAIQIGMMKIEGRV